MNKEITENNENLWKEEKNDNWKHKDHDNTREIRYYIHETKTILLKKEHLDNIEELLEIKNMISEIKNSVEKWEDKDELTHQEKKIKLERK